MDGTVFSYDFSREEIKSLVWFLRDRQNEIPKELFPFTRSLQNKFYSVTSIDEVEQFYKK